jgi:phage tail-like protein
LRSQKKGLQFGLRMADIRGMATGKRNDPYGRFNFLLEIDGVATAGFSEVSGLTSETEVIEYREGSDKTPARKIPGLNKFSNITLKRGITQDRSLWTWRKTVADGATQRANLSIILLDESRQPVARWNVREAWPCKWEGPSLNAKSSEVAIETLELAHEGIELA